MQRRSVLFQFGGWLLAGKFCQAVEVLPGRRTLLEDLGVSAQRLADLFSGAPNSADVTSLCRLLARNCESDRRASPALVQSARDAGIRCLRDGHGTRSAELSQQMRRFEELAEHWIFVSAETVDRAVGSSRQRVLS